MTTFLTSVIGAIRSFILPFVSAQQLPSIYCGGLPGCSGSTAQPANILFTNALPEAIRILANVAAAGSIIFILWAGAQMMLAFGDEGKTTQARSAVIYALGGLILAITSQSIVAFTATEYFGQESAGGDFLFDTVLPQFVRVGLTLVNVLFVIVIMIAGIRMAAARGSSEEYKKALGAIKWAIIGAIVMNVSRALVEAIITIGF